MRTVKVNHSVAAARALFARLNGSELPLRRERLMGSDYYTGDKFHSFDEYSSNIEGIEIVDEEGDEENVMIDRTLLRLSYPNSPYGYSYTPPIYVDVDDLGIELSE